LDVFTCGGFGVTVFVPIVPKTGGFLGGGGKCYRTQNVCFDFLYNFCLKHFSF